MKKRIIIFIFAILCLIPFNTFAEEINKTKTVGDLSIDELIELYSKFLNFDNFIISEKNTSRVCFSTFYDDMIPYYKSSNTSIITVSQSRENTNGALTNRTYCLQKSQLVYKILSLSDDGSMSFNVSDTRYFKILYSTLDILNQSDDSVYFAKNFSYKKKVVCPDVNVDIPITKEEFYVLLMLVSLLILLLFFKWCFPMKGGKKI